MEGNLHEINTADLAMEENLQFEVEDVENIENQRSPNKNVFESSQQPKQQQ